MLEMGNISNRSVLLLEAICDPVDMSSTEKAL